MVRSEGKGGAGGSVVARIPSSARCTLRCNRCERELPESEFPKYRLKQKAYWCRTCSAEYKRVRRAEKTKDGVCRNCEHRPVVEGRNQCAKCLRASVRSSQRRVKRDPRAEKMRMKAIQQKLKLAVFVAYGGPECRCCGEDKMEFLSIDHLKGDGAAHRKKLTGNPRNGSNLYHWLKKNGFPKGFRVLCLNCNFAYGHFGYCPHQRAIT